MSTCTTPAKGGDTTPPQQQQQSPSAATLGGFATMEEAQRYLQELQRKNALLREEDDRRSKKMDTLKASLRETACATEREEEQFTNALIRKMDSIGKERSNLQRHLVVEHNRKQQLEDKLVTLRKESQRLQRLLIKEENTIKSRLQRQLSTVTEQREILKAASEAEAATLTQLHRCIEQVHEQMRDATAAAHQQSTPNQHHTHLGVAGSATRSLSPHSIASAVAARGERSAHQRSSSGRGVGINLGDSLNATAVDSEPATDVDVESTATPRQPSTSFHHQRTSSASMQPPLVSLGSSHHHGGSAHMQPTLAGQPVTNPSSILGTPAERSINNTPASSPMINPMPAPSSSSQKNERGRSSMTSQDRHAISQQSPPPPPPPLAPLPQSSVGATDRGRSSSTSSSVRGSFAGQQPAPPAAAAPLLQVEQEPTTPVNTASTPTHASPTSTSAQHGLSQASPGGLGMGLSHLAGNSLSSPCHALGASVSSQRSLSSTTGTTPLHTNANGLPGGTPSGPGVTTFDDDAMVRSLNRELRRVQMLRREALDKASQYEQRKAELQEKLSAAVAERDGHRKSADSFRGELERCASQNHEMSANAEVYNEWVVDRETLMSNTSVGGMRSGYRMGRVGRTSSVCSVASSAAASEATTIGGASVAGHLQEGGIGLPRERTWSINQPPPVMPTLATSAGSGGDPKHPLSAVGDNSFSNLNPRSGASSVNSSMVLGASNSMQLSAAVIGAASPPHVLHGGKDGGSFHKDSASAPTSLVGKQHQADDEAEEGECATPIHEEQHRDPNDNDGVVGASKRGA